MTTGSYNTTITIGSSNGYTWTRTKRKEWSGQDQAPSPKRPKEYETVVIPPRKSGGAVIPGFSFRRRKYDDTPARSRKLDEHAYAMTAYDYSGGHYRFKVSSIDCEGTVIGNVSTVNPWTANDDLTLIGKLREKILGADLNLGVTLAEGPKAISMIADSAIRIRKSLTALRKGRLFDAEQLLVSGTVNESVYRFGKKTQSYIRTPTKEDLASKWLELQYGWKPLLKDTVECLKYLEHQTATPRSTVVTVTHTAGGKDGVSSTELHGTYYLGLRTFMRNSRRSSKKLRAVISDVNGTQLLGLMDPYAVAWELTPYSFVADWFVPVGTYLDALRTVGSVKATYITATRFVIEQRYSHSTYDYPTQTTVSDIPQSLNYNKVSFSRSISGNLSVPLPEVKPWSKVVNPAHALNAVALLVNRFGSK